MQRKCFKNQENYQNGENNDSSQSQIPSPSPSPYRNDLRLIEGQYPNVVNDLLTKYIDYYENDGTYKRLPLKDGTRHLPYQIDEGVLKHFRINTYLNTDSNELTYPLLEKLLQKIVIKKNYKLIFESKKLVKKDKLNLDYIHQNIVTKLMKIINDIYEKDNYELNLSWR